MKLLFHSTFIAALQLLLDFGNCEPFAFGCKDSVIISCKRSEANVWQHQEGVVYRHALQIHLKGGGNVYLNMDLFPSLQVVRGGVADCQSLYNISNPVLVNGDNCSASSHTNSTEGTTTNISTTEKGSTTSSINITTTGRGTTEKGGVGTTTTNRAVGTSTEKGDGGTTTTGRATVTTEKGGGSTSTTTVGTNVTIISTGSDTTEKGGDGTTTTNRADSTTSTEKGDGDTSTSTKSIQSERPSLSV